MRTPPCGMLPIVMECTGLYAHKTRARSEKRPANTPRPATRLVAAIIGPPSVQCRSRFEVKIHQSLPVLKDGK